MFDNALNIFVVVIALVVFIGRTVLQTRARKKAGPQQVQVPGFFRDEDDDEDDRKEAPSKKTSQKKSRTDRPIRVTGGTESVSPGILPVSAPIMRQEPTNNLQSLNNLSPLKHAVVMAEILGPPKSLREE